MKPIKYSVTPDKEKCRTNGNTSFNFPDPLGRTIHSLLEKYPYLHDFFKALSIPLDIKKNPSLSLQRFIDDLDDGQLGQFGLDREALIRQILEFISQMNRFLLTADHGLECLIIKPGMDKNGDPESLGITLFCGEVVSIVGPTGSGKSQLLADIECLAQSDTPSKRRVLPNGLVPDEAARFSGEYRLVAQLSQNMNFVMDLSVKEFLTMHALSRLKEDAAQKVTEIYDSAVMLAGEPFSLGTPITSLSGGQSRALMIADVAYLSASPIVLIDEIENAGVDRQKAVSLLLNSDKIVLIATHDPLLALSADRRIIIKNGGIADVVKTSTKERESAACLAILDKNLGQIREMVRNGEQLVFDSHFFFKTV